MPPPKELPGFYFDPEKNRYFPIKGPIPGLKRPTSSSSSSIDGDSSEKIKKRHVTKAGRRNRLKALELLQFREVLGTRIVSSRCRYDFKHEYEKLQACRPQVWKYQRTASVADSALEKMVGVVQTPKGLCETYLLSLGSMNGSISLCEIGSVGQFFDSGSRCTHEPVWPEGIDYEARNSTSSGSIWCSPEASTSFSSSITCIRRIGRQCLDQPDGASFCHRALVTTLGSGVSGGSVYLLNLTKPLDFSSSAFLLHRRTLKVASFDCTMWTADCSRNGARAVIGTNLGAALIDLETRASSWVYRTKSDIFSQQFDHSGNVVLCGLRNGAIIEVDVRDKQSRSSVLSSSHTTAPNVQRINYVSPNRNDKRSKQRFEITDIAGLGRYKAINITSNVSPKRNDKRSKQRFEARRNSTSPGNLSMSSAVCSLVALQSDDQYFLGSSMDGSIKLFDRRLLQRGAIQSYEGHVNSHSHLQLGVNPSETLMLSGGEDNYVRIWSVKTSELIFEENVSNSILATVCWSRGIHGSLGPTEYCEQNPFDLNHSWGAWLGSHEGLFYMHGT